MEFRVKGLGCIRIMENKEETTKMGVSKDRR